MPFAPFVEMDIFHSFICRSTLWSIPFVLNVTYLFISVVHLYMGKTLSVSVQSGVAEQLSSVVLTPV